VTLIGAMAFVAIARHAVPSFAATYRPSLRRERARLSFAHRPRYRMTDGLSSTEQIASGDRPFDRSR